MTRVTPGHALKFEDRTDGPHAIPHDAPQRAFCACHKWEFVYDDHPQLDNSSVSECRRQAVTAWQQMHVQVILASK
jgi:hypothetical protein